MRAYEAGQAMYFATPPVNLIYALNASLTSITKSAPSLPERLALHKEASARVRKAIKSIGLKALAKNEGEQANGMTAVSLRGSSVCGAMRICLYRGYFNYRFISRKVLQLRTSSRALVLRAS